MGRGEGSACVKTHGSQGCGEMEWKKVRNIIVFLEWKKVRDIIEWKRESGRDRVEERVAESEKSRVEEIEWKRVEESEKHHRVQ